MPDPNDTPPMPPTTPAPVPDSPSALGSAPVEAPIGAIVDPTLSAPKLVVPPTPEQLAAFPPPPPIVAPRPEMEPAALSGSTPDMPMYQGGDRLKGLGMTMDPNTSGREYIVAPEPSPAAPKRFHELKPSTQAEVRAFWEMKHPGQPFPVEEWIEPVLGSPVGSALGRNGTAEDPTAVVAEVEGTPVKIPQRTLDEMQAGKARLAEKRREIDETKHKQAQMNAELLNAGKVSPSDMDYAAPKG